MIQVEFLGAMNCVGAAGVLIDTGSEKIVLDYGTKVREIPPVFPLPIKGKIDALLLTHSHLDHSGALPLIARNDVPVFSLPVSKPLTELLLLDSIKISSEEGITLPYDKNDVERSLRNFVLIKYKKSFKIHSVKVTPLNAGHIPGSTMFLIESKGKKILYTGDFNTIKTRLVKRAKVNIENLDCLIVESTYSQRNHPDRKKQEKELIKSIEETLSKDGIALIPSFAVSRAQEILLILNSHGIDYPLYLDGMAKKATTIILKEKACKNIEKLKEALKHVRYLNNNSQRKRAIKHPSVIVTTSGMLQGGPIIWYLKRLYKNENCSLTFVGYQIEGTPGRILLESGHYINPSENLDLEIKMRIKKLDFSSHAGRNELFEFVEKLNPQKIFCIHGDNTEEFAEELKEKGFDAIAPLANNRIFQL